MTDQSKLDIEAYSKWWFINGGHLHRLWKTKSYTAISESAHTLPKLAWEAGIAHRDAQLAKQDKAMEDLLAELRYMNDNGMWPRLDRAIKAYEESKGK